MNRSWIIGFLAIWIGISVLLLNSCKKNNVESIPDYILAGANIQGTDIFELNPDSILSIYPDDTFNIPYRNTSLYQENKLLFDIDTDGVVDLAFTVWWNMNPAGIGNIGSQVTPLEGVELSYDSLLVFGNPSYYRKFALPYEYLGYISDTSDWTQNTCYFDYLGIFNGEWDWDDQLMIWEGLTDYYLGFRKHYPGTRPVYGWMSIEVLNYNDIRIRSYGMTKRVYLED